MKESSSEIGNVEGPINEVKVLHLKGFICNSLFVHSSFQSKTKCEHKRLKNRLFSLTPFSGFSFSFISLLVLFLINPPTSLCYTFNPIFSNGQSSKLLFYPHKSTLDHFLSRSIAFKLQSSEISSPRYMFFPAFMSKNLFNQINLQFKVQKLIHLLC